MSTTSNDPREIGRLAAEVSELGERLDLVGSRLRELSTATQTAPQQQSAQPVPHHVGPRPATPPAGAPQPPPPRHPVPPAARQPVPPPQAAPPGPPAPPKPPGPTLAERLRAPGVASRAIGWVGAGVTLLGVVLLLILAIQRGWLGPTGRVAGAALLGAALLVAGLRVHRRETGRAAAYALCATGLATLYLAVLGATSLYGLLSVPTGLVLALVVAAGGLVLADRWREVSLAVGTVLGCAVSAPLLTWAFDPLLAGFLLVLQLAVVPAWLRRGWRPVLWTATGAAVAGAIGAVVGSVTLPDRLPTALVCLAVAVVGIRLSAVSARRHPRGLATAAGLVTVTAAPVLLSALLLDDLPATVLAGVVALLTLLVWGGGTYLGAVRARFPQAYVQVCGAVGLVAALEATLSATGGDDWAAVLLGESLAVCAVAAQLRSRTAFGAAWVYTGIGWIVGMATQADPRLLVSASYEASWRAVLVGLLTAAAGVAVLRARPRVRGLDNDVTTLATVYAGLLVLYGGSATVMASALLAAPGHGGFITGHLVVTVAMTAVAIGLLLRGIASVPCRIAGLTLLGLALAKLFLYDLAALDGLVRVLGFLAVGLVMLAAGTRYARLVGATS